MMSTEAVEIMGEIMTTMFSKGPKKPPAVEQAPPALMAVESPTIAATRAKRSAIVAERNRLNLEIESYDRAIRFFEEHGEAPKIFRFLIDQGIAVPVEAAK